jgi:hypothetical protein
LAALMAGQRGCSKFLMHRNDGCSEAMDIFCDANRQSCVGEILHIDIGDYTITVNR